MKTCRGCNIEKPLTEFYHYKHKYKNKSYPNSNCKLCDHIRNIKYHHENRAKVSERQVASHRVRKYGISEKDYESMLLYQNNVCAICYKADIKSLSVDHCHITGKIRGLLCSSCNMGIGMFKDNPSLLNNAIGYLYSNAVQNQHINQ